jgi:hypothetical protein
MDRPTCFTCPYWYQEGDGEDVTEHVDRSEEIDDGYGECRRHAPPALVGPPDGRYDDPTLARAAETANFYWCGDHPDFPAYAAAFAAALAARPPARPD